MFMGCRLVPVEDFCQAVGGATDDLRLKTGTSHCCIPDRHWHVSAAHRPLMAPGSGMALTWHSRIGPLDSGRSGAPLWVTRQKLWEGQVAVAEEDCLSYIAS